MCFEISKFYCYMKLLVGYDRCHSSRSKNRSSIELARPSNPDRETFYGIW